jgi:BirA family biotin operon repressor/biotin-[acetyl-CoA-carboxylase] ligase
MAAMIPISKYRILSFPEIDSTNSYALKHLQTLCDKQIILAETQTQGHGRMGRPWISTVTGNIYMSLVLKPSAFVTPLTNLTQYLSLVICKLIENYGPEAEVKWPNDVLVAGKKIAGILGEGCFRGEAFQGYVLGAGINLNMNPEEAARIDQPATALSILTGRPVNRDEFLKLLLDEFFTGYEQFLKSGFPSIKSEYSRRCSILGKRVYVRRGGRRMSGTAFCLLDDGTLSLLNGSGKKTVVAAGDVCLQLEKGEQLS